MTFDPKHTYLTSDHHFGSWQGLPCFQVFTKDQEDEAVKKWNSTVVAANDTVIYLGDFHDCNLVDLIAYQQKLNGRIVLVKGNHDVLPDDVYMAMFDDVIDELWIDDICLRHNPNLDYNGQQIFGHLHREGILDPCFRPNGLCVCASMNNCMPILLKDAIENLRKRSLQSRLNDV